MNPSTVIDLGVENIKNIVNLPKMYQLSHSQVQINSNFS